MPQTKNDSSDEEWVERPAGDDDGPDDRHGISDTSKNEKVVRSPDEKDLSETRNKRRAKDDRSAETSPSKSYEERRDRNDDKHRTSDRHGRREDKSRRENANDDESRRSKKYDDDGDRMSSKKPRRDDMDSDRMERGNQQGSRDAKYRDDYHNRGRNERERFKRKGDRRDYGSSRRDNQSGGSSFHSRGRGRNEDRDRWRGKERKNDREDRSTWDIRPSADEVAKQKKLLWGKSGKSASQGNGEEGSGCGDHGSGESAASTSNNPEKNVGLWSSAITACGVAGDQANKFLKLMGIKNVPVVDPASEGNKRLQEESEKQRKMMRELDRQYEIARETTHMGRGLGLGFHQ